MRKFKRILAFAIATSVSICSLCAYADNEGSSEPDLRSSNVLLMDDTANRVIYERNGSGRIAPGGFAKVMTAILTIDSVNDINESVTANSNAVNAYDFNLNNMGVLPGETLSVKDLLYGMLIYDAGEAANALAVHVSQSMDNFVEKMNEEAKKLGCTATNFTNPSGMPDENQYSSLSDIALIINHAMENETFAKIVSTKSYTISPSNKYYEPRYLNNTNKFLVSPSSPYFDPCVTGAKTSYVSNSDCGIALTYVNGGTSLLCLVANAPYENGTNYANEDAKKLISYGTSYYVPHKIMSKDDIMAEVKVSNGKDADRVLLIAPETLTVNLPKDFDEKKLDVKIDTGKKTKAPIAKGDALGQVTVMYDGDKYATMILVADSAVNPSFIKGITNGIASFFTSWIFITAVTLIITLFVIYTILLNKAKRRRKYVSRFR